MESVFFLQTTRFADGWRSHVVGNLEYHATLASRTRISLFAAAASIAIAVLLVRRLIGGVPFIPAKGSRSFTIFNKADFLNLYDKDEIPASAPIEPLDGSRRWWAWGQTLFLGALVGVNAALLGVRTRHGNSFIEEAVECAYWALLLALFAFRFYPTPYRAPISKIVLLGSLLPLILLIQRDIVPRMLKEPSFEQLQDARRDWGVYTRVALNLMVELCALATPRMWYPVDPYGNDRESPEQTACLLSYMGTYSWIGYLVRIGLTRDIEPEDLPELPDYDRARLWSAKVEKNKKKTIFRTFFACMKWDILCMALCGILTGLSQFLWPLSMKKLLAFIEGSEETTWSPWLYVFGIFVGPLLTGIVWEGYIFNATRLIIRVKAAFTQSLLHKTLKMRFTFDSAKEKDAKDKKDVKNGKDGKDDKNGKKEDASKRSKVGLINNLMSTDLEQLTNAREVVLLCGTIPIQIVLSMLLLYNLLGWASFVGVALMVASLVVPILLARVLAAIQKQLRLASDARIGLMTETLTAVRVIKFFGLEDAFLERIRDKREKELKLSLKSSMLALGFHTISKSLPIINILVTFGLFTTVMGQPLTASIAFTSMSLFDMLTGQFAWVSFVTQQVLYAFVSFERLDKFINGEEEIDAPPSNARNSRTPNYENATLSWTLPMSEMDNNFRLSNLNVECPYGGLTVVAGPVGSGKTSFLLGLLGEMRLLDGEYCLPRQGGVSYAAQTPWLEAKSIRENILFGSAYEEKRYEAVIEASGLRQDLENLDAGDETEIGERGTTLSGGQKARISLARAVYAPAQTVLLDDVLSALDANTSKLVAEKCIKGDILAGRTVVLVTHHVSLVSSAAKKIIILSDGKVASETNMLTDSTLDLIQDTAQASAESLDQAPDPDVIDMPTNKVTAKGSGKLITEEGRAKGRIPIAMIWDYVKNWGGYLAIFIAVCLSTANQLGLLANPFFLSKWSDEYTRHPKDMNVGLWLGMYCAVLIGATLLETFTYVIWYILQWFASRRIHERLVKSVLYSPIRFFDTTPIGRIINRLSNDVKSVDSRLGIYLQQVFHKFLESIFRVVVMSGLIPAFFLPVIAVATIGMVCGQVYVRASLGVKRIVSVRESPLFSHFGDTISGMVTIRGFGAQNRFLEESLKRVDDYSQPNEAIYNLNRWIGVRISWCTALIGLSAGVIALTSKNYSAGLIGFSLSNILAFSNGILYSIKYFTILEVELNSFERINEYTALKQEPAPTPEKEPPAAWPVQGSVKVTDLSVKYYEDGPEVLNKVSFDVKPNERVGIVGRTGSGKSSLALSFLRFTEISKGNITINGIDIQNINLSALRRRVTIIPQDPVLLSGTIRTNLDPFDEVDDLELQAALEGSGLGDSSIELVIDSAVGSSAEASVASTRAPSPTTKTSDLPTKTKKITLDTPITAGGDNLSQGQRQLLAFARALVRRSKLLLLDEATSSTDNIADERIQETLRTSFPESSLIVIAHRLRTVMHMDRILVLDNRGEGGEVVEFDTPLNLLDKQDGVLRGLAEKSGEFEDLVKIARHAHGEGNSIQ